MSDTSSSKTPSTPGRSDTSTNRIHSQHIETPSPSPMPEHSKSATLPFSLPRISLFNIQYSQSSKADDKKKDSKVRPRSPILTKEILEKAGKIEEKLVAHKDAKTKFQLSYLLSPKKLRNYQKEKKVWKSQDPINLALTEAARKRFSTPKKDVPAPKPLECTHFCNQKLDPKVIKELSQKFQEIDKLLQD